MKIGNKEILSMSLNGKAVQSMSLGNKEIWSAESPEPGPGPGPGPWYADYLCFTANTANSKIQFVASLQSGQTRSFQYSTNKTTWTNMNFSSTGSTIYGPQITLANIGDKVYFRGTNNTLGNVVPNQYYGGVYIRLTGSIAASGNLNTLLSYTTDITDLTGRDYCFYKVFDAASSSNRVLTTPPYLPATILSEGCYNYLFQNQTKLTLAPQLLATTLADYCYSGMFLGCTSLTYAPRLKAMTVPQHGYDSMFRGCISITEPPKLPAISLADYCYFGMFMGCTGLTSTPRLPALTLAEDCYHSMFQGCTGLTVVSDLPATTTLYYCYASMFRGCTNLITPPTLNATTLASSCYSSMFYDCIHLTSAPDLPAATLASSCYSSMFKNCTSLTQAPDLLATNVPNYAYSEMFNGCTGLLSTGTIAATSIGNESMYQMFRGCTSLTSIPVLDILTIGRWAMDDMFYGCTSLYVSNSSISEATYEWKIPYSGPATYTYGSSSSCIFTNCLGTRSTDSPSFTTQQTYYTQNKPIQDNSNYLTFTANSPSTIQLIQLGTPSITKTFAYSTNKTSWTTFTFSEAGVGPVINLSNINDKVYFKGNNITLGESASIYNQFIMTGNISISGDVNTLLSIPDPIPDLTGKNYVYYKLFQDCTALSNAPELFSTTLSQYCYAYMFEGCTGITTLPLINTTILANYCYLGMFKNCTGITTINSLPIMTLAEGCYSSMFEGCSNLTTVVTLRATALAIACYKAMFKNCTSLTSTSVLSMTNLYISCYESMYEGCTSLVTAPRLTASTLVTDCYKAMFKNCTSLYVAESSSTSASNQWKIPNGSVGNNFTMTDMFTGCLGSRSTNSPNFNNIQKIYYTQSMPIPQEANYLCFTARAANSTIALNQIGSPSETKYYAYSRDKENWTEFNFSAAGSGTIITLANIGDKVYYRGYNQTTSGVESEYIGANGGRFSMTGQIDASGELTTLLDYTISITDLTNRSSCFTGLFYECSSLYTAPLLSATILAPYCYNQLFYNCTHLTTAPLLPATTLANKCYMYMFGSSGLTTAPILAATTLATSCYSQMFMLCENLIQPPALPATTLANSCYYGMFSYCYNLSSAPELSAMSLTRDCYSNMFVYCTSLKVAPNLPATTLAEGCYQHMFEYSGIVIAPTMGAITTMPSIGMATMFKDCDSLITVPSLTATTVYWEAYGNLFSYCSNLQISSTETSTTPYSWRIPTSGICSSSSETSTDVFEGCAGSRTSDDLELSSAIYTFYTSCPPISTAPDYLCFTANTTSTICLKQTGTPSQPINLQYSTNNGSSWNNITITEPGTTTAITVNSGSKIYYRGNNTRLTESQSVRLQFVMTGSFNASGNLNTLLTYTEDLRDLTGRSYCFAGLFANCTSLKTAPQLRAVILSDNCYNSLFGNTGLTTAPILPAPVVETNAYYGMFNSCTSLTTAAQMFANTIKENGCCAMYYNCSALTTPPNIKANYLEANCFTLMFASCTSLQAYPNQGTGHNIEWCIPSTGGTQIESSLTMTNMFYGCLGETGDGTITFWGYDSYSRWTNNAPV